MDTNRGGPMAAALAIPSVVSIWTNTDTGRRRASGHRAFEILEVIEAAGGSLALSAVAEITGLTLPTIHRLIRALVARLHPAAAAPHVRSGADADQAGGDRHPAHRRLVAAAPGRPRASNR
jgi:hypothetical protein